MPAATVASIATTGAIIAASGIVVGSLPVTIVGPKTLTSMATAQIAMVAPDNMIQNARRPTSVRSRAIGTSDATDPPRPQSHVVTAAIGIRCCSLPEIMSGANTLMMATEAQIDATVAAVQPNHEFVPACDGTVTGGGGHPPGVPAAVDGVKVVSLERFMPRQYEATSVASSDCGRNLNSPRGVSSPRSRGRLVGVDERHRGGDEREEDHQPDADDGDDVRLAVVAAGVV